MVNKQDALQKAQQFVAGRQAAARGGAGQAQSLQSALDNSYYYVFNIGTDGGFVIVSGDDRTPEILGYSDAGHFDAQNIPDNMRAFLQGYADEIQQMPETMPAASRGVGQKRVVKTPISPLLVTEWGQDAPYNAFCPTFQYDVPSSDELQTGQSVTGCVATAMAQIMYYHQWPISTKAQINGYQLQLKVNNTPNTLTISTVPADSPISWSNMLPYYGGDYTAGQAQAVAKLMQYCGAAVEMRYGANSSGAYDSNVRGALIDYFDYDEGMQFVYRNKYTAEQWDNLIYGELVAKRPVFYGGQSSGGGHAFVVDGYQEGYFHINWGWDGRNNDGMFLLSVLNPYNTESTGASSSKDGYSYGQDAIIGIQKNIGTVVAPAPVVMSTYALSYTTESVTKGGDGNFSTTISLASVNLSGATNTFDYGIGIYDKNDNLCYSKVRRTNQELENGNYFGNESVDISFGDGWEDGVYTIVGISKTSDSENWNKNRYSDSRLIYAIISGNTMTLMVPDPALRLESNTMTVVGDKLAGSTQTVKATIVNNGTPYNDYLYLAVNGQLKGGRMFEIGIGETKDFEIELLLDNPGNYTLRLYSDKELTNEIVSTECTISANEDLSGDTNVDLSFDVQLNLDESGQYILGNKLKAKIIATNNTANNYVGKCILFLYTWIGDNGSSNSTYWKDLVVRANSQAEVEYEYDVELESEYSVKLKCKKNGADFVVDDDMVYATYVSKPAITTYLADGTEVQKLAGADFEVPSNASVVDLRGQTSIATVDADDANPNCIYLLDSSADVPTGLTRNVVKGNIAENIELQDSYDFYSPINFTATQISYERTFTNGTDATGNRWSTIILPFDVVSVTAGDAPDEEEIDWFHSSEDRGKNFWVRSFVNDMENNVYFDYTEQMKAGTPYIITVPGSYWGKWDLTNKTIRFIGKGNTAITKNQVSSSLIGDNYHFVGMMAAKAVENVYVMNDDGTQFENRASATADPFRAYFKAEKLKYANALSIKSVNDVPTTIGQLPAEIATPAAMPKVVYTLDGRRVTSSQMKKGVYIVGGKKIIK